MMSQNGRPIDGRPFFFDFLGVTPSEFLYCSIMSTLQQRLEIEVKLALDSFPDYLKVRGFLGNPDKEFAQTNCFFDSEDRQLHKDRWALRVRVEDDRGLITLKGPSDAEDTSQMATIREEIESEIDRSVAQAVIELRTDVLSLDVDPVKFIKKKYPDLALSRLVQFENERLIKQYKMGSYSYDLELDKTVYGDGSTDYELEVEVDRQEEMPTVVRSLQKLFESLKVPFERQTKTKFERALERTERF